MPALNLTKEQEHWLANVAWKKFTLTQISKELKVSHSFVSQYYSSRGIECTTSRDLITQQVFKIAETREELHHYEIAKELKCSPQMVKQILEMYDIKGVAKKVSLAEAAEIETKKEINKLKKNLFQEYKNKLNKVKKSRIAFTVYNQTGSDMLDDLRGIKTTGREDKYCTNV